MLGENRQTVTVLYLWVKADKIILTQFRNPER